ncbi:MAG: hypothetical protein VYA30_14630 [Myxococcota bacterium]|nr:hypothetical protein [Myxococcota bacterium]
MTRLRQGLALLLLALLPNVSIGHPPNDLRLLLSSIDRPLTQAELQRCHATVDELLEIAGSSGQSLYRRGRAIAALGQLADPSSLSGLIDLWDRDLQPGLQVEIVYAINAFEFKLDLWHLTSLLESRLPSASPPAFMAITRILGLSVP